MTPFSLIKIHGNQAFSRWPRCLDATHNMFCMIHGKYVRPQDSCREDDIPRHGPISSLCLETSGRTGGVQRSIVGAKGLAESQIVVNKPPDAVEPPSCCKIRTNALDFASSGLRTQAQVSIDVVQSAVLVSHGAEAFVRANQRFTPAPLFSSESPFRMKRDSTWKQVEAVQSEKKYLDKLGRCGVKTRKFYYTISKIATSLAKQMHMYARIRAAKTYTPVQTQRSTLPRRPQSSIQANSSSGKESFDVRTYGSATSRSSRDLDPLSMRCLKYASLRAS